MKLKKVNDSKEPTPKQMLNMAENLRKVYNGYSTIEAKARQHSVGNPEMTYSVYIHHFTATKEFKIWPELMEFYRKLLKEGLNGIV